MKESKITSHVTELPSSCKSVMEHMESELKKEDEDMVERSKRQESKSQKSDSNFQVADLPESCESQIHDFERELNKQGYWNIALVAYQMKD